jgi:hypothetical protein
MAYVNAAAIRASVTATGYALAGFALGVLVALGIRRR